MTILAANPYDLIFGDEEGTRKRFDFVMRYAKGTRLIECACGTGDLLKKLSDYFDAYGIDLDENMLAYCKEKYPDLKVEVGDFLKYKGHFDSLVCLGDSLNYLHDEKELLAFVENSLSLADTLILDCHHPYRLLEFHDGYEEEGSIAGLDYSYMIQTEGSYLQHVINYLDGRFDVIEQWVFDPQQLVDAYKARNCKVKVFTDFEDKGISAQGEKVMLVVERGNL